MKLSIIIPSRNERFLAKTVDDIFKKAKGDFEVVVVLDEKDQPLKPRPKLRVLKKKGKPGLRSAINQAVDASKGKFIMKTDAHCMFDEGFDVKLKADCDDDWVVIPRRYSLLPITWERNFDRPIIDYEYMPFPYRALTSVRLGGKWWERAEERKDILLDEGMAFQGSCWFTTKKHLKNIGGYDLITSTGDEFVLESEELANKTWLSGGKVMVNKKTWYAHLHKGNTYGRGYFLSSAAMKRQRLFHIDYWMNDKWPKAKHTMKWLVDRFWPIPTWPDDWQDPKYKKNYMIVNRLIDNAELEFILGKYGIDKKQKSPIHLECTRWGTLPKLFLQLEYKRGAEIGVAGGRFSKFLCHYNPSLRRHYAIDAWKVYPGYKDNESQEKMENLYQEAKNRLAPYDRCRVIRDWSMEAVKKFKDESLDYVYIDAAHDYKSVKEDIREWSKKVRKGGIVAGHDYINGLHGVKYGVKQAVNEWVKENKIKYLFVLKKDSDIDQCPTWMYVK